MILVVGLGNPGKTYEKTRHNIGFRVLDIIAEEQKAVFVNKDRFKAALAEVTFSEKKVILLKPQTYMNLSGESIIKVINFYQISRENVFIVYDDIDLEFAQLRIRDKGRSAGHNGIKSIIECLGSEEFSRLKIGVSRPPAGWDPADYVLSKFSKEEEAKLPEVFKGAIYKIEEFIKSR